MLETMQRRAGTAGTGGDRALAAQDGGAGRLHSSVPGLPGHPLQKGRVGDTFLAKAAAPADACGLGAERGHAHTAAIWGSGEPRVPLQSGSPPLGLSPSSLSSLSSPSRPGRPFLHLESGMEERLLLGEVTTATSSASTRPVRTRSL